MKSTTNARRAGDVTELLRAWSDGDRRALEGLTPIVYSELRRLAHRYMEPVQSGFTTYVPSAVAARMLPFTLRVVVARVLPLPSKVCRPI